MSLTAFQGDTHQPYYVHAHWGRFSFRGILAQVDVTYKLFDRAGEPLRATFKLQLKEALSPEEVQAEDRPESPDLFQTWLVGDGETLDAIAARVYGDPAYWRPLASANGLTNPRGLRTGSCWCCRPSPPGRRQAMSGAQPDRPEFEVTVGGTALEPLVAADVIEIDVHEEVGRHGRCTLLVQNWDADTAPCGRRRRAVPARRRARCLHGLPQRAHPRLRRRDRLPHRALPSEGRPTLRVEARARSILLEHPPRSRQLADVSDADVVAAIAADYSLEAGPTRSHAPVRGERQDQRLGPPQGPRGRLGWALYARAPTW